MASRLEFLLDSEMLSSRSASLFAGILNMAHRCSPQAILLSAPFPVPSSDFKTKNEKWLLLKTRL